MRRLLMIAAVLMVAIPAFAQAQAEPARILLPVMIEETAGAYGSLWSTEVWYRNDGAEPVQISPLSIADLPPTKKMTLRLPVQYRPASQPPGGFIYVSRGAKHVRFSLFLRDLSRQDEEWGVELPVVRESDFHGPRVVLINVPTDPRYRQALRIYEGALDGAGRVRVEIFPELPLQAPPLVSFETDLPARFPHHEPGYAQVLSLIDQFPAIRGAERVRVEITALTPGANLWAFVALTNNSTQHVALITPQ